MRRFSFWLVFFLFIHSTFAWAGIEANFLIESQGGKGPAAHSGRLYIQDPNFRMDMMVPGKKGQSPQKISYIQNKGINKEFSVIHAQKMFMEISGFPKDTEQSTFQSMSESRSLEEMKKKGMNIKKVGKEKYEGYLCTVYEMTGKNKDQLKTAKIWFADKLNFHMVKMTGKDQQDRTVNWKLSQIQNKNLGNSVFLPPSDYKTMAMPGMVGGPLNNSGNAPDPTSMIQEIQRIQKLPPEQRESEMQKFRQQMMDMQKQMQGR